MIKAVINGQGQQVPSTQPCPVGGQMQKGDGISAARETQRQWHLGLLHQSFIHPVNKPAEQISLGHCPQRQLARVRAWVARVFKAALAVGA